MTQGAVTQDTRRENIGAALRLLRTERGWTQTRLAEVCSSRSSLAAYEAGQSEPQVTTLLEILEALGYHLTDFAQALDRVEGKTPAAEADRETSDVRVRRRAFMVVDLSEEEVPHDLEQDMAEWEDLLERLTAFTYRHGAAAAAERRKAERKAREDEASGEGRNSGNRRKAAQGS